MNVRRSVIVNLVGGLDNNGNCEVGMFGVRGVPLRSQVMTAMYEIYVCQEWARANNLIGSIKLSEYLMGLAMDQTLVRGHLHLGLLAGYLPRHAGQPVQRLNQGAHQLYSHFFEWYCHCVRQRQEPGVWAGVEGDHDTVRASGADSAHQEHSVPMEQIEVESEKFNMVTTEAEFTRLESELSFLQVIATMTLQETIRQVKAEICENRKQIAHTRLESIAGG
jgi:hypothetical protein